jgi:hypothetical protein
VNSSYESFIHVNIVTTSWIQNPFIPIYVMLVIFIMILSFIFDFFLKIHFGHKHIKPPKNCSHKYNLWTIFVFWHHILDLKKKKVYLINLKLNLINYF